MSGIPYHGGEILSAASMVIAVAYVRSDIFRIFLENPLYEVFDEIQFHLFTREEASWLRATERQLAATFGIFAQTATPGRWRITSHR